jgi:hypothetical protein
MTRDIGELLSRTEYADGIDFSENGYDTDDPWPDRSAFDSEDEGDDVPTQEDLDFIDDGPVEDGVTSDEEEELNHGRDSLSNSIVGADK